jgi:hypothetical protein
MGAYSSRTSRRRSRSLTSILCPAACFSLLCCGGAITSGTGATSVDGGDEYEASDAGTSDGARPECNSRHFVTCKSLPPPCPTGDVPVVAGTCWAGYCAKPSTCRSVNDCGVCNPETDICATDATLHTASVRCVSMPAVCANDRTCQCLGSYLCTTPSYDDCNRVSEARGLVCFCNTCP